MLHAWGHEHNDDGGMYGSRGRANPANEAVFGLCNHATCSAAAATLARAYGGVVQERQLTTSSVSTRLLAGALHIGRRKDNGGGSSAQWEAKLRRELLVAAPPIEEHEPSVW